MFSVSFFHHIFFFFIRFIFEVNLLHQSDFICLLSSTWRRILNESEKMRKEDKMIKDQNLLYIHLFAQVLFHNQRTGLLKIEDRFSLRKWPIHQKSLSNWLCISKPNISNKQWKRITARQEDAEQNQNQTLNPTDDEWRVFNGAFQFDFNRTVHAAAVSYTTFYFIFSLVCHSVNKRI